MRDGRPSEVMLFETPKRSFGAFGVGEVLGLRLGLLVGAGLTAGRAGTVARGEVLASLAASVALVVLADGCMRALCGLAVGRGDPAGRVLCGLVADLSDEGAAAVAVTELPPWAGAGRNDVVDGGPERSDLPSTAGFDCGLGAGRVFGRVLGLAEGLAGGCFAACFGNVEAGGTPPVRAGNVDRCAERGLTADGAGQAPTGEEVAFVGDDAPLW